MDQHAKGDTGISEQRDKSQSAGACSLCFNNAPYVAAFSCGAFNANLMSPLILNRPFGTKSSLVQNCCFTLAHVGVGLCIYKSVHQRKDLETYKKVLISATGSVLFNYGTHCSCLQRQALSTKIPDSQVPYRCRSCRLHVLVGKGIPGRAYRC
ncbi:hypothetical protein EB796_019677 [Bugula neritina]|uniref:Uncharacterized protein n=1 Tax=Bugula neritina TaxID=10212 RepID=A0A7J7J701_BUGNE|nr:hypothetical protein EB796_019677 [Bugula neritina]